jgi:cytochrome c553
MGSQPKMGKPLFRLSVALIASLALPSAGVAADERTLAYGRHLAQECSTCHRLDGTNNGIPSIVGQDAARFAETIGFYKTGARSNAVMISVAQSLDEDQVKALAAYYASLPKPAPNPRKKP